MTEKEKIALIIYQKDEAACQRLLTMLKELVLPENITAETIVVQGTSLAAAFQQGMEKSAARWKFYLTDSVAAFRKDIISLMLAVLAREPKLGLLGVAGSAMLPPDADSSHALAKLGALMVNGKACRWQNSAAPWQPALSVEPYFFATQADIPWRQDLLKGEGFVVEAQSFEMRRHGLAVGVLSQNSPAVGIQLKEKTLDYISQQAFLKEYGPWLTLENIWRFFSEIDDKRGLIEQLEQEYLAAIRADLADGLLNNAMEKISYQAIASYRYNQRYTRDELEDALQVILQKAVPNRPAKLFTTEKNTVLFYDGFGLDLRGLAQIYIRALTELGYHVIYVADAAAAGRIPAIRRYIEQSGGELVFAHLMKNNAQCVNTLIQIMQKYRPEHAFFYTWPHDIPAMLAFMLAEGSCTRYQINLTDHAFWLGRNVFDYCLEFRDYGAVVSRDYRKIPAEKLLIQPYYPVVNQNTEFQGFPFEKKDGDFVIFSGGALYKTMDDELTYYKMVDYILNKYPQVKFWFALGLAQKHEIVHIKKLRENHPEQFFVTNERSDLMQLLKKIDIYLNTYPLTGGLMTQYAALAGKVPLTFVKDMGSFSGLLYDQENLRVAFIDKEEFKAELDLLISDADYRQAQGEKMNQAVISPVQFAANLQKIIKKHQSDYSVEFKPVQVTEFLKGYYERFIKG